MTEVFSEDLTTLQPNKGSSELSSHPPVNNEKSSFHEWDVGIKSYGYLAILIFGTLTNITSLIVLRSKSFKTSSISGTLSVLSLVHLAVLYTSLLTIIIKAFFNIDIKEVSIWCKIHLFIAYFILHLASWTLTLIVIERTFIVCFPLLAKCYITSKNAAKVWLITALLLVCVNCHFFFTFEYQPETESLSKCDGLKRYDYFLSFGWHWIHIIISTIIPFLLIFSGNIIILVKIKKALVFQQMSNNSSNETKPDLAQDHNKGNITHSTKMLLCMSVVFLILTLPSGIYFIKVNAITRDFSVHELQNYSLTYSITSFFFYLGYCINCMVYYLTGSKFRKCFKECFSTSMSSNLPLTNTTALRTP